MRPQDCHDLRLPGSFFLTLLRRLPASPSYMLNLEDITLQAVEDVGMDFWWCVALPATTGSTPTLPLA